MIKLIVSLIVVLVVVAGLVIAYGVIAHYNSQEKEADRRWTDPKFRDHISKK